MNKGKTVLVSATVILFLVVVVGSILMTSWPAGELTDTINVELGEILFDTYGISIIMVGFVLFASLLGGIFIAQEEEDK